MVIMDGHSTPVCELRGGLSAVISPNTSQWEDTQPEDELEAPLAEPQTPEDKEPGDEEAPLLGQAPGSEDNNQPLPEEAKKRSIRRKIKKLIRKPFDKLRNREEVVLPGPPHAQAPPPLPRREGKRQMVGRAVKKLFLDRPDRYLQIIDEEVDGTQSGASQVGSSQAGLTQSGFSEAGPSQAASSQSMSSGVERAASRPHGASQQDAQQTEAQVHGSSRGPSRINFTRRAPLDTARQTHAQPVRLTQEMVTAQSSGTPAQTPLSSKEAKNRAAALRRDRIEQNNEEFFRQQAIRDRERIDQVRRFIRSGVNRVWERRNSGGDGNDEGGQGREDGDDGGSGEGGEGGEQRPNLFTRLSHRIRDQDPTPETRVPPIGDQADEGEVGQRLGNAARVVFAAARAALGWDLDL